MHEVGVINNDSIGWIQVIPNYNDICVHSFYNTKYLLSNNKVSFINLSKINNPKLLQQLLLETVGFVCWISVSYHCTDWRTCMIKWRQSLCDHLQNNSVLFFLFYFVWLFCGHFIIIVCLNNCFC